MCGNLLILLSQLINSVHKMNIGMPCWCKNSCAFKKRWCKKGGQGSHSIMHTFAYEVLLSNTTTLLLEQEWVEAVALPPWLQNQGETNSWHYTLLKSVQYGSSRLYIYTIFTMSWQTISDDCMLKAMETFKATHIYTVMGICIAYRLLPTEITHTSVIKLM